MAEFTVHSIPGSPFGRAVLLALEEKGAPWTYAFVPPPALKQPEHLARHPFGRVPVLEHGGFRLYETQAILRYIDRVLPNPPLTPTDPRAAARMDQVMSINDWYLFQGGGAKIVFQRIISPRIMGGVPDEAIIAAALPQLAPVIAAIAELLGTQQYFAGDALSLADLHLAPHLDMLAETPEWAVLTAAHPNLVQWLARMRARPSMAATSWDRQAQIVKAAKPVPA